MEKVKKLIDKLHAGSYSTVRAGRLQLLTSFLVLSRLFQFL
jgi:hypothetical protein